MFTCPNCNKTYDIPMNFCIVCGTPMAAAAATPPPTAEPTVQTQYAEQQYAPPQPVQVQPQYVRPQYANVTPEKPVIPTSAKVKSIVGMALAIEGLASIAVGLLYTAIFLLASGYFSFMYGLMFCLVCTPFSLVGLILSNNAINSGSTWKMAKIGKILGIVGLILCGVTFFVAIVGFMVGDYHGFFDASYLNDDYYYY